MLYVVFFYIYQKFTAPEVNCMQIDLIIKISAKMIDKKIT
jgi:hypothetical protein